MIKKKQRKAPKKKAWERYLSEKEKIELKK